MTRERLAVAGRLLMGLVVLGLLYALFPHSPPMPGTGRYESLSVILDQANQGRYFQAEPGVSMNIRWTDLGLPYLSVILLWFGRSFVRQDMVWGNEIFYLAQALVMAAAMAIQTSRLVSRPLFLGFLAATILAFVTGTLYWHWDCYWAPGFSALLSLTALLAFVRRTAVGQPLFLGYALASGILAGVAGLLRQDAGLLARGAVVMFAAFVLVYLFTHRRLGLARQDATMRSGLRSWAILLRCGIFLIGSFAAQWAYPAHMRLHQWVSGVDHQVGMQEHGIWHSFYIGLGLYEEENPYGIRWNDEVGFFHASLQDPDVHPATAAYLTTLRKAVGKVALDDPAFVLRQFQHKIYLTGVMEGKPIWTVFGLILALAVWFSRWRDWPERLAAPAVMSCTAAALAVPVLIIPHPNYSTGINLLVWCAPLLLVLVLAPSAWRRLMPLLLGLRVRRSSGYGVIVTLSVLLGMGAGLGGTAYGGLLGYSHWRNAHLFQDGSLTEFLDRWRDSPILLAARLGRDMSPEIEGKVVEAMGAKFGFVTGRPDLAPPAAMPLFTVRNVTRIQSQLVVLGEARMGMDKPQFQLAAYAVPGKQSQLSYFGAMRGWDGGEVKLDHLAADRPMILVFPMNGLPPAYDRIRFHLVDAKGQEQTIVLPDLPMVRLADLQARVGP